MRIELLNQTFGGRLQFANPQRLAPLNFQDPQPRHTPWLPKARLSLEEQQQLFYCVLQRFVPAVAAEEVWAGGADFFAQAAWGGLAECPLEWWQVLDPNGAVLYRLWLYNADSGVLVVAGTTQVVAEVLQCTFYGPAPLGPALALAQLAACRQHPAQELAKVTFA